MSNKNKFKDYIDKLNTVLKIMINNEIKNQDSFIVGIITWFIKNTKPYWHLVD